MLIGEVVPEAYKVLSQNPAGDELGAFDHIVVNSTKISDALEQSLLDVLAADASLCVAGDDDQSIYSVRYANPDGIHEEFMDRAEVEEYHDRYLWTLPVNNFGDGQFAYWASSWPGLIAYFLLETSRSPASSISCSGRTSRPRRMGLQARLLKKRDLTSGRLDPGEILVLTNWRKVGEAIRQRLKEVGIPVRSFFTEEELSSDEAKTALALLRLAADENDMPAMRVLLSLGDGAGRTAAYQRLLKYCRANAVTPTQVL